MALKHSLLALMLLSIILSCKNSVAYDNNKQLEEFIKNDLAYPIRKSGNNTMIIFLQNIDCMCTAEDVSLAKDLITSEKYDRYQFFLIIKGEKPNFIKQISKSKLSKVKVFNDSGNTLIREGYIATSARIIIYESGNCQKFIDLHEKPAKIARKELLSTKNL